MPAIVWFCGGSFRDVDKSVWLPVLMPFAERGYVIASVEYRTSNIAKFPAPLEEGKAAVHFLKEHAGDFAIDPEKICVMGESAGGSIASLLGVTLKKEIAAIVDFYGLVDLTWEFEFQEDNEDVPPWLIRDYLGNCYSQETAAEASAVYHVSPDSPATMIIHGVEDPLVPIAQSEAFYDRLTECQVEAELLLVERAGHGDDLCYQEEIICRIDEFLRKVLK